MKLLCYALSDFAPRLVAAPAERQWMGAFNNGHPYRCLPLSIANSHGWMILCPTTVDIHWNGGPNLSDLTITSPKPAIGRRPIEHFCTSNFTNGIATFHVEYIFQTEPGWDLLVTGPFNSPKNNAYPLTGIIESDWLPYPFTMNWRVMQPGSVRFTEGEPFCMLFPIKKQALLECELEICRLKDNIELRDQYELFRRSRTEFLEKIREGDLSAGRHWQRHYFSGRHPDGHEVEGHLKRLRLKEPKDLR